MSPSFLNAKRVQKVALSHQEIAGCVVNFSVEVVVLSQQVAVFPDLGVATYLLCPFDLIGLQGLIVWLLSRTVLHGQEDQANSQQEFQGERQAHEEE
ncbi:hypothetical protein [Persicitalea jodogahamensis]|uniref:hypothetical protein n=1 Tax=Persicitalea jodogahamensis TaxID=402147 RepID=UPI0016747FD4|nr:hypothetical protein [Persicitalea jodogahamensis]